MASFLATKRHTTSQLLMHRSSPRPAFRNADIPRTLESQKAAMKPCRPSSRNHAITADVVVVGSGLAGLTATYSLLQENVPVVLVEAAATLGGNSCKASSGMNSLNWQTHDSAQDFVYDMLSSGGELSDIHLVDALVQDSEAALRFIQEMGVDLNTLSQLGGHSHARTHRTSTGPNVGFAIMKV